MESETSQKMPQSLSLKQCKKLKISHLSISQKPFLTLKYAFLYLVDEWNCFWKSIKQRPIISFYELMLQMIGILILVAIVAKNLQPEQISWLWKGIKSSIGFEAGKSASSKQLTKFIWEETKNALGKEEKFTSSLNFSPPKTTPSVIAFKLAPNLILWSIGNLIGNVPRFLLARNFFVHLPIPRKWLLLASLVPMIGCFPILAGAGGSSLMDFCLISFMESFLKNVVIQSYIIICATFPSSETQSSISKLAVKLNSFASSSWWWTNENLFHNFHAVKTFLLFAWILKCTVVMLEHCAKVALAKRQ